MRKLMYLAIGFAAACGLFAYGLTITLWIPLTLACVMAFAGWKSIRCRAIALVMVGLSLGCFRCDMFQRNCLDKARAMDGVTETVTLRTSEYGEETDYGTSADCTLILEDRNYAVRVYLAEETDLEPGMLLTGEFRFLSVEPGEYLAGEGIYLTARQEDEILIEEDSESRWLDSIPKLRKWLNGALEASVPADVLGLAKGLLLGDTSELDYEMDTALKVSGIRHVVAVSGLHVSILMGLLATVTFRRRWLTVPVGAAVLVLFAALAGFSPSVTRACLMAGLMLGGLLFDREYDGATALSFAAVVMLAANPLVIGSVSFQLSAASVAGIFLFTPRIKAFLENGLESRFGRWVTASVAVTLGATVMTMPLCALYFGMVSLVSPLTNLLVLWVIGGIFYGLMGVCLLYALWGPGAVILGKLLAWPVRYVLWVAGVMAKFPLAAVYTQSVYVVFWLIFVYILLFFFRFSKKRRTVELICCVILSLCAALTASMLEREDTRVTVLDVGQGQCIVLEQKGRVFLVDCGGDTDDGTADLAAGYLLSRGIRHLDGLILTHLDDDHAGGAQFLMSRIETDLLILPEVPSELTAERTVYASEELRLSLEDGEIRIYPATFPGRSNEKSLCVLFDTEKCDILITGDRDAFGERMLLRSYDIPDVDILIAGHHGSKHSTSEELLAAVSAETVCISAGKNNRFGHPAEELLQRLESFGCDIYRTDKNGTITFRR